MQFTKNILDFWYNLEFFSPFWPQHIRNNTTYIHENNKNLVWLKANPKYTYDVYLGKFKTQELLEDLLTAIGEEDDHIDQDYSQSCLCAFRVSSEGMYIEKSFSLSTFVYALAKMIQEKNMKANLSNEEINQLNNEFDEKLTALNKVIEYDDLEKMYTKLLKKLGFSLEKAPFHGVINKKFAPKKEAIDDSNETAQTDMLTSFYVSDLDMIRKQIKKGDRIVQYIEALKTKPSQRIEIDHDVQEMKKWLQIEKYPLGKWPSKYSPSLMQQLAINIGISDHKKANFFSVNGPPGTGKTTLLKEIIAAYVVERAVLLSEYEQPDDAFQRAHFLYPDNKFLKTYYQIDPKLKKYGILVASNNNAAVENISKELPLAEDVKDTNTDLFNMDQHEEVYFSNIATALLEEDSWGLISARLGRKSNLNELKQALWFNKEEENLQDLYKKEDIPNWEGMKTLFKVKYNEVLDYRKKIRTAIDNTNRHKKIVYDLEQAKREMAKIKKKVKQAEKLVHEKEKERASLKQEIDMLSANEQTLTNRIPFYKKLLPFLFKMDPVILQLHETKKKLDAATIQLVKMDENVTKAKNQLEQIKEKQQNFQTKLNKLHNDHNRSCQLLENYKKQFGSNFADDKFWENIEQNEASQLAAPWTDKTFDTLREELFYYALLLHKAFILNSKAVRQNLNVLMNMWSGNFHVKDRQAGYAHVLNTLFLVVPVVSTTFASVSRFLEHIGQNELGTLIVDEAGQAAPHFALGALWRTSKAIIVGDPLQVEPVVDAPNELLRRFADELNIDDEYRSLELSVQVLADNINPFGGYREYQEDKLWLGCPLVIHRRSLDPMFSISNEIAYNNRMFKQTAEPKKDIRLLLEQSKWIDIKGKEIGGKDHYVPAQGEKVIEMVINAFEIQNGFPSLYIISPFKSVVNQLKKQLRESLTKKFNDLAGDDIAKWVNESCGTVHTFQGKEANEVLFVLGCDRENGLNAAQWAGKKPNILNVAMTRAKYRIAVIGDSDVWKNVPYFDYAYEVLTKQPAQLV